MRTKHISSVAVFFSLVLAVLVRAQTPPPPYCRGAESSLVSFNYTTMSGGNGASSEVRMSQDGRRMIFNTFATSLVNDPHRPDWDIVVWDRDTRTLTSVGARLPVINSNLEQARISGDGSYVAFRTMASNVDGADHNGQPDLYGKELATGRFERISMPDDAILKNEPLAEAGDPVDGGYSMDATGRYFAFVSSSRSLSYDYFSGQDAYGGNEKHVYVRDRIARRTWLVSKGRRDNEGKREAINGNVTTPLITADGRSVFFMSDATNIEGFPAGEPRRYDVYRADYDPANDEWKVAQQIGIRADIEPTHGLSEVAVSPSGRRR
jgi:hypothetical protein